MKRILSIPVLLLFLTIQTQAQIWVSARTYQGDSLVVRWVPTTPSTWEKCSKQGYILKRFSLSESQKTTPNPDYSHKIELKTMEKWRIPSENDPIMGMAAQAYWGQTFGNGSPQTHYQEQIQRHSFALLAADISTTVAEYSGLRFADRHVKEKEDYLYLVTCTGEQNTDSGFVFIRGRDEYHTAPLEDFSVKIQGELAEISWKQGRSGEQYVAFEVYKSIDKQHYFPAFSQPVIPLSKQVKTDTHTVIDSLKGNSEVLYKLRGITSFGDKGDFTDPAKGIIIDRVEQAPRITRHENTNGQTQFQFTYENKGLNKIELLSSESFKGDYDRIEEWKSDFPEKCTTKISTRSLYYKLRLHYRNEVQMESVPYAVFVEDSLPPANPVLKLLKYDSGKVNIAWETGNEPDLLGIRVFRSFKNDQNFIEITSQPLLTGSLTDSLHYRSKEKVFYKLISEDLRHNRSVEDTVYMLQLPDLLPPETPIISNYFQDSAGVQLQWLVGNDSEHDQAFIFRKEENQKGWKLLNMQMAKTGRYGDASAAPNTSYYYLLTIRDVSGNESAPSKPVMVRTRNFKNFRPPVLSGKALRTSRQVELRWTINGREIGNVWVYRSERKEPFQLLGKVEGRGFYDDDVLPGNIYKYKVVVINEDGGNGEYSNVITIKY